MYFSEILRYFKNNDIKITCYFLICITISFFLIIFIDPDIIYIDKSRVPHTTIEEYCYDNVVYLVMYNDTYSKYASITEKYIEDGSIATCK